MLQYEVRIFGLVRDSFWSTNFEPEAAKAEYLAKYPWLAADRVSLA